MERSPENTVGPVWTFRGSCGTLPKAGYKIVVANRRCILFYFRSSGVEQRKQDRGG
jgi:hypothetical protein